MAGAFSRTWPVGIDRSIPRGATDFPSPECVLAGADSALASAPSALGSPQTALGAATAFWASPTAFDRGDRSLAQGLGIDPQTSPPGPQGAADGTTQADGGRRAQ